MTDYRALCAELLDWAEVTAAHYIQLPAVMLRARAALADEPAVPEGREPVAVIGEPSDKRPTVMEIIELSSEIEAAGLGQVDLVRAALTRWGNPAPQPLAEGEVAELVAWLRANALTVQKASGNPANGAKQRMNRAAELLQRLSPPQPVPVSERPWEREGWCAEDDRCWVWNRGSCEWWELVDSKLISYSSEDYTHCLPAHALPLPEVSQ